ncbi:unknown protein [Parachlamydia acanthamoebae UV-7]|uniref:Uncharacterized protein n=1 Tax=Parachlamydia acanthamoebae (strain UV7) TaxID=765952 RepID=F8L0Z4_PARAV|nr:unknown protein [Parachlamydia acanthamoebae UV-7]
MVKKKSNRKRSPDTIKNGATKREKQRKSEGSY